MTESVIETTDTAPPVTAVRKGAILGTAPTWKQTPWGDQELFIASLNDAYVLPGFQRANAWFDLHPIPEMVFRPKGERIVSPDHAPVGGYLRPEGHLEWLKTRNFPVYLHDCRECDCAARLEAWKRGELPHMAQQPHDPYPFPAWPNAKPFPFKAIESQFGQYWGSTPAWMLAWMLVEGYQQVHIYGIHLATEWEYIHQRPNLEFLIGMALGRGVQFVIPDRASILKGKHKYAVESKPNLGMERAERLMAIAKQEGLRLRQRLAALKWYDRAEAADIRARLRVLELELLDARQDQNRLAAIARVA